MKTFSILALAAVSAAGLYADFSYTQTQKMTGGMLAAMAGKNGPQTTKIAIKGQKMKMDSASTSTLIDLDAQTITTINNAAKTYTVRNFADLQAPAANLNVSAQVKETGQTKMVNGFKAQELVMTLSIEVPQVGPAQLETTMWISPDVPGYQELHAFHTKNAEKFPWSALAGGGNPGMGQAIAEIQKMLTSMNGAPVQEIVKMKSSGGMGGRGGAPAGPSAAQMSQMSAGMEKARKQLEAMVAQGGPAAAIAKQQLDRMGPAPGAAAPASTGSSDSLLEMTMDSSDFSSASVPDSVFEIPAGYTKN